MSRGRKERDPLDRYDIPKSAVRRFLARFQGDYGYWHGRIWEPAAGTGNIADVVRPHAAHLMYASDIEPRAAGIEKRDYLEAAPSDRAERWDLIITNPPFRLAEHFIYQAMYDVKPGGLVVMFLRAAFLESAKRRAFFDKLHRPEQRGRERDGHGDVRMVCLAAAAVAGPGPRPSRVLQGLSNLERSEQ